jgi:hypothetical protein
VLSLRELQLSFATAVLDGSSAAIAPWIRDDGLDPAARVGIYRNNLHEGFLKALSLGFPVIQRLVGEDYFRQVGRLFLAEYPSRAGNLHHVGAPFARFLRDQFGATPYSYLPDVAELEWAYQECLIAPDSTPFDPTALQTMPPERFAGLRFDLHPACKLVSSEFPIVRIWRANQDDRDGTEVIDLRQGADFVLVRRNDAGVEVRRLSAADFALLRSMNRGGTLGDALQVAVTVAADFDLATALRQFVGLGVLARVHTPTDNQLDLQASLGAGA